MADLDLDPAVEAARSSRQPFAIDDHDARCCVLARAWLERLDATFHRGRAGGAPPAWIARRFVVVEGESTALHWCEIPDAALGDAAATALARELWSARSDDIRAVQLVSGADYREAIGRVRGERLEIWDCVAGAWLAPQPAAGASLAVRVGGEGAVRWGDHRLPAGEWVVIAG